LGLDFRFFLGGGEVAPTLVLVLGSELVLTLAVLLRLSGVPAFSFGGFQTYCL
jgi:hypothetical protein